MMDERDFQLRADAALNELAQALARAAERYDFDSDFNAGALTVEFEEPPAKFVVSPNSPVRQIWVSANVRSYKLDWNEARGCFLLASTGQTLPQLMAECIGAHLGEAISL